MATRAEKRAAMAAAKRDEAERVVIPHNEIRILHGVDCAPDGTLTRDGEPVSIEWIECKPSAGTRSHAAIHLHADEDPTMKIQFTSVHLHKTIPRLDAGKGQATQSTTHFTIETGHIIELDTASGVVRIAKGTAVANIPREGVERFGPTVAEAAAHVEMLQTIGRDKAAAIAAAEIESLATAAVPSVTAPPAIEQNVPLSPNAIAAAL